jgi:hypothetical protein
LAFWIASIDSVRIVLMQSVSMSVATGCATVAIASILVHGERSDLNGL